MDIKERYSATTEWLFGQLAMFSHTGASAYKPGLATAHTLDEAFGSPSRHIRTIHIAGTNGKGSTAHTLAAVLQSAGYRTGLYTSPHLVDFRERIRVNGTMISREAVVDFVDRYRAMGIDERIRPSFFELTTIMAFEHFVREKVDVAVIETGLGGRLDTTNIITPEISIITNISLDHTALLGDTPAQIAAEKAGIIKPGVPVVIGEVADEEVREVFELTAARNHSPILFAQECINGHPPYSSYAITPEGILYRDTPFGDILGELRGEYQPLNSATALTALMVLREKGMDRITAEAVARGFSEVNRLTGLAGRWMKVSDSPLVICDTGHNPGGWEHIARQLASIAGSKSLVVGFVADKDVDTILAMIARIPGVELYVTQAQIERALPADRLLAMAREHGVNASSYPTVAEAYAAACDNARSKEGMVYVGGSTFIVADLLASLNADHSSADAS